MMKFLFFAILLISLKSYSQNENGFKKYTYFIVGFKSSGNNITVNQGSGFFIKRNSKMYFVTAKHVLMGVHNGKKDAGAPTEMMIMLHDEKGRPTFRTITLNVKKIQDTSVYRDRHFFPDGLAYELKNYKQYSLYSLESSSTTLPLPANRGEILMCGYPYSASDDYSNYMMKEASVKLLRSSTFSTHLEIMYNGKSVIDSINYGITTKEIAINESLDGFSGSPIFVKDTKLNKWVYTGLLSGSSVKASTLSVVRPKSIKY